MSGRKHAGRGAKESRDAQQWLRYAREELYEAEVRIRSDDYIPRLVCLMSQQAVEKALKAVLVYEQIPYPRQHDLDGLRALVPRTWAVRKASLQLGDLTEWAIEARYPSDLPDADENDAREAVTLARTVFDLVANDLAAYGITAPDPVPDEPPDDDAAPFSASPLV